jgi:TRAP-type C4-dicarboxylate transport system permease small subunit
MTLAVVGLQSFFLGCIVQVIYNYSAKTTQKWLGLFSYTRAMIVSALLTVAGLVLVIPLTTHYVSSGLFLPESPGMENHMAVTGLLLLIAAFMTFSSTLILHAAALHTRQPEDRP